MSGLDPQTWKRLAPLLDEALELAADERPAFLDRALPDEPELRAVLEELIAAESRVGGPLDTPVVEDVRQGPSLPRVDGFEDLEEIGRGGMGVVYRALRRGDGFEQPVALKIVRASRDDPALLERFERERSILARLEHPNIARLVDGGTTRDGRPYFAMEYVDGVPITEYADSHRLTLRERLRLFAAMCRAVAFAQQQLVVHRDLKPSNILVDTEGRVRLLDFGIAHLVDPEGGPAVDGLTRDGARLLTPEYAAPEQLRGERPTTATDVFALGVILFELLSGRHPHGSTRDAALEFALGSRDSEWLPRAVDKEHRELRPDGTVELITKRMVAEARGVTPRALRRALGGDLAVITGKALRRDPAARYASAEALLADLDRHREGRPITARSPSWGYSARMAFRRHRVAFTTGLVVLIAIGAGLGVSLWQARVAAREAERAVQAYDFLAGLFRDTHPDATQGVDWSPSELLARGADRLAVEWADDPEARAMLLREIAVILTDRGDYDPAARLLRRELGHEDTADNAGMTLALARLELIRENQDVADSLLRALDARGEVLDRADRASVLESAASVLYQKGSYAAAESLTRELMVFTAAAHGERSTEYAADLGNLAVHLQSQSRFAESESLQQRALEIVLEVKPGPSTDAALALHNLGDLYQQNARHGEAADAFAQSVAMREKLYPDGHRRLAGSLRGLASAQRNLGNLDVADSLLAASIEMVAAIDGARGEEFARALNSHAVLAYVRGDHDAARERFARALEIFREDPGPTHPVTLTVASNLATVQMMTGELEAAERTYREILERRREILGDEHGDVAFSYNSIGQVLRRLDRADEAIELHREALRRYLDLHGPEHATIATSRTFLGSALREAGRIDDALAEYERAIAIREATLPAGHRDTEDSRLGYAQSLLRAERWRDALAVLDTVDRNAEGNDTIPQTWIFGGHAMRGLALARTGELERGRAMVRAAVDSLETHEGPDAERTVTARALLESIEGP